MPDLLSALIAFVGEHRRCGDLHGGLEVGVAWLDCTCGARLARPAEPPAGPDLARPANLGVTEEGHWP